MAVWFAFNSNSRLAKQLQPSEFALEEDIGSIIANTDHIIEKKSWKQDRRACVSKKQLLGGSQHKQKRCISSFHCRFASAEGVNSNCRDQDKAQDDKLLLAINAKQVKCIC